MSVPNCMKSASSAELLRRMRAERPRRWEKDGGRGSGGCREAESWRVGQYECKICLNIHLTHTRARTHTLKHTPAYECKKCQLMASPDAAFFITSCILEQP